MNVNGDLVTPSYSALLKSKVLVLTGAGASVPLKMPAMEGFYELLPSPSQLRAKNLFGWFPEYKNDLEELIGHLSFYQKVRDAIGKDQELQRVVNGGGLETLLQHATEIREDIFDVIVEEYGPLNKEARPKAVELYKGLYTALLNDAGNDPEVLPIFTTNYDLTFEAIRDAGGGFELCNGLALQGDYKVWDPNEYKTKERYRFAIFRLHGCSRWVNDKKSGEIVYQPAPSRRDLERAEPCVLYPIPGKEDRIGREPFSTAYWHFEELLKFVNTVVVIGYSGRDPAVQARLREAVRRRSINIVVVTGGDALRPELREVVSLAASQNHIKGGIEGNTDKLLKAVRGEIELNLVDSMQMSDSAGSS